jgi:hypothetical protein
MDGIDEECETRVALVLTLILLGKLVGEVKVSGSAAWVRLGKEWLKQHLAPERDNDEGTWAPGNAHCDHHDGSDQLVFVTALKASSKSSASSGASRSSKVGKVAARSITVSRPCHPARWA